MPSDDRLRALTLEVLELRAQVEELRRLVPRQALEALDKATQVGDAIARYRRAGYSRRDALAAAKATLGLPRRTFYRALRRATAVAQIAGRIAATTTGR